MQKVKVHRYVSGKKPDYAQDAPTDSESEDDDFIERRNRPHDRTPSPEPIKEDDLNDPRLRRLKIRETDTEIRPERRRHIVEPEILESSDDEEEVKEHINLPEPKHTLEAPEDEESEAELSDSEIEKRRQQLRQRVLSKQEEQEFLTKEEEKSDSDSTESSEYEEYSDSEEETGTRLKPVFVRKRDRITVCKCYIL